MARKVFTFEERKQIVEDYKSGMSLRQVAEKYNTSHSAVQRYVDEAGATRDLNGIEPKKRPPRPGTIMSKGPELRKLYEANKRVTLYTLADQYNCSIHAIRQALLAAGTTMRQAGGDKRSRRTRGLLGWLES
jgi:transposase-like protein